MLLIKKECEKQFENWQKTITESNKTAKLVYTVGKGFREVRAETIDNINWEELTPDSWVLVFNDFDFTATREFLKHGITNIVMVSTDFSDEQTVNKYFFKIVYPNTVIKMLVGDKLPWKAVLQLKRTEIKKDIYRYTLEGDHKEYMAKKFDSVIANFPFSLGNDMTKFIIDNVKFKEGSFANVLPISKYKKGTLTKYIIPGTIKNNQVGRQASDFDGADTYPIICRLSSKKTNELSFEDFERVYCCNREEGLGKKFFEEQDRRITAEEAGTRKKAFVDYIYYIRENNYDKLSSKTSFTAATWTPHIAHGWGVQEVHDKNNNLKDDANCNWNFRKLDKQINEVYNVAKDSNGKTCISQCATVFATEQGKDNFVHWWFSSELTGGYRHCGLSTILLRWMNKSTQCAFDYIIPRVDWDNEEWTDEKILKDYGYTPEEIKVVLHYNDDLIPASWLKAHEGK